MVIRYNYIKKINNLLNNDDFYNQWSHNVSNISNHKLGVKLINSSLLKRNSINFFRYFFWIFFSNNTKMNKSISSYLKSYKYLLNYLYLLNFFKSNNIKYYNLFYSNNLNVIKKNKKIQRKFIRYLVRKKKVKILFVFKQNNFVIDFFYNSLNKRSLRIYEITLINPKFIFFFFYLNHFK